MYRKSKFRRLTALFLALILAFSMTTFASAAADGSDETLSEQPDDVTTQAVGSGGGISWEYRTDLGCYYITYRLTPDILPGLANLYPGGFPFGIDFTYNNIRTHVAMGGFGVVMLYGALTQTPAFVPCLYSGHS
jgi:hypothetical protein